MKRSMSLLSLTLLSAALLVVSCSSESSDRFQTREQCLSVCAQGPTLEGIDVSYWQGSINWDQVAADGISFAFIRVSDGTTTYDNKFQYNWSEAKRVGIVRGVYQFFRPNQDPVAQADLLISEIGGAMTPGDLPPVIDVESSGGLSKSTVVNRVAQWVDRIETVLGVSPIIYTSPGLWSSYANSSAFGDYTLWVAHYYVNCPTMPTGWSDWEFHQYTDSGDVDGIGSVYVDRNVFNGTMADLQALTYGDPICGDGYCNGGEDHSTCPGDCPICEPVPAQGRIVDETDICFEMGGDPQYWREESGGYGDSLMWTYAVSSQFYNYGIWHLSFEQAGTYRVEAYTPAPWSESEHAKYQVHHDGGTTVSEVDQSAVNGWNTVGEFYFAAGDNQWVRLEDLTGESSSSDTMVVVDAIRIVPVTQDPDPQDPDPQDPDPQDPDPQDPDPQEPEEPEEPVDLDPDGDGCDGIPLSGRIVEETELCVELGGDSRWWRSENEGWENSLQWTHAVSSGVFNYAVWNLSFLYDGSYRLEAYIAAPWGESKQAKYQVNHAGGNTTVEVDQSIHDGWTVIGVFEFVAGAEHSVRLEDYTGEANYLGRRVVVDAIRLVRVGQGTGSTDGNDTRNLSEPSQSYSSQMGCRAGGALPRQRAGWALLSLLLMALGWMWSRNRSRS